MVIIILLIILIFQNLLNIIDFLLIPFRILYQQNFQKEDNFQILHFMEAKNIY